MLPLVAGGLYVMLKPLASTILRCRRVSLNDRSVKYEMDYATQIEKEIYAREHKYSPKIEITDYDAPSLYKTQMRYRVRVSKDGNVVCISQRSTSDAIFSVARAGIGAVRHGTKECPKNPTAANIATIGSSW